MQAQGLPGITVTIAKNGAVLYSHGYGYANLSTCQPVQPATEFQIGSVTKQFTAAAILQLQNAGSLNIDNTVLTYLPTYPFDPRITVRMLLNNTSGLADYMTFPASASWWANGVSQTTVIGQITQAPLLFSPGSAFSYSNSNYFILGAIIEAVSSVSYPNYMATNIFQPLGLAHTSYLQPSTSASPYVTGQLPGVVWDPSVPFSAGALWSDVQDLAIWDAALRNGNVIPAPLFTLMVTPPSVPDHQLGSPSIYGMGWVRSPTPVSGGHTAVFHNGMTPTYTAFNSMFLDTGFSVTALTNLAPANLQDFGISLNDAICTSAATAANC